MHVILISFFILAYLVSEIASIDLWDVHWLQSSHKNNIPSNQTLDSPVKSENIELEKDIFHSDTTLNFTQTHTNQIYALMLK